MVIRKTVDDATARAKAEYDMTDLISCTEDGDKDMGAAHEIISAFVAVEFETASKKLSPSETVFLRRVVLTGPWEVDPTQH